MDAIGLGGQGLRPVRYAPDSIVTDRANAWQMHEVPETLTQSDTCTHSSNKTSILAFPQIVKERDRDQGKK